MAQCRHRHKALTQQLLLTSKLAANSLRLQGQLDHSLNIQQDRITSSLRRINKLSKHKRTQVVKSSAPIISCSETMHQDNSRWLCQAISRITKANSTALSSFKSSQEAQVHMTGWSDQADWICICNNLLYIALLAKNSWIQLVLDNLKERCDELHHIL